MSRQAISGQRHILRALAQWPKDTVRPQIQFQDILAKRFENLNNNSPSSSSPKASPPAPPSQPSFSAAAAGEIKPPTPGTTTPAPKAVLTERELLAQANALYGLLGDRFKRKYPIQHGLLTPRSKPTHFADLVRELEEGPKRSLFERLMVRLKGSVRYQ